MRLVSAQDVLLADPLKLVELQLAGDQDVLELLFRTINAKRYSNRNHGVRFDLTDRLVHTLLGRSRTARPSFADRVENRGTVNLA